MIAARVHEAPGATVELHDERRVVARFAAAQRVLSFAPDAGGFGTTRTIAIVGVRNAELPIGRDFRELLRERLADLDDEVVPMMTSRALHAVDVAQVAHEDATSFAIATVGLSNAVVVGDTPGPLEGWGTVNLVAHVDRPLTDVALVEMLSIVAEARTVAILEAGVRSRRSEAIASGTGTDCIVVACPAEGAPSPYAGKHTAIGHVVGAAVLEATRAGIARWRREVRP